MICKNIIVGTSMAEDGYVGVDGRYGCVAKGIEKIYVQKKKVFRKHRISCISLYLSLPAFSCSI